MNVQPNVLQKQMFGIAIYESETVLTDYTGPTPERYLVDPARLITILNLPEPAVTLAVEPGMFSYTADRDSESFQFAIPKKNEGWTLVYRGDKGQPPEVIKVFLPAFVLGVEISRKTRRVSEIRAWCHGDRGIPNTQTTFYEMPLPNFSGAKHCLGGINVLAAPGQVRDEGLAAIFDGYFNRHADLVGKKGIPFHKFVAQHQGRFPLRSLRQISAPSNLPKNNKNI